MDTISLPETIFQAPCSVAVMGPTMSGKSSIVFNIIKYKDLLFNKPVVGVKYCYSVYTKEYDDICCTNIEFYEGLPTLEILQKWCNEFKNLHFLLIMDDLIDSVVQSNLATQISIKYMHHFNFTNIVTSQNIFFQGKGSRTQSLNFTYIFLTRSCRELQQIQRLGSQIFPNKSKEFLQIYKDSTDTNIKNMVTYLLISCHPLHTKRTCQLMTNIFPPDLLMILYKI